MNTALLVIDVQNDYFPLGAHPLPGGPKAGKNVAALLHHFRTIGLPVVHVRHETIRPGVGFFLPNSRGAEIAECARPMNTEPVVIKNRPNSFVETDLAGTLKAMDAQRLLVCGMMTNMCVDATVRAAVDRGYECLLAHDACAASDLAFGGVEVDAVRVHAAFVSALAYGYSAPVDSADIVTNGLPS